MAVISRSRLRRRTTLTAAALLPVLVTSCDLDPPREDSGPGQDAPADADSVLVASVVTQIASAEAVLAAAVSAAPALRRRLDPLATSHAAHRALLVEAAPEAASEPASPVDVGEARAAVLGAVRRSETRLQRTALKSCVRASSGDLARVLASLAASTSQHLAALDDTARGTP